jgi:hypothetical protein
MPWIARRCAPRNDAVRRGPARRFTHLYKYKYLLMRVLPFHFALAHGGAVVADGAAGRGAQIPMMAGIVADGTADECTFKAALGESRRGEQR